MLKANLIKKKICPINLRLINKVIEVFEKQTQKIKKEVEIIIIGDKEMTELNRFYRGKNKTTDVLSFAFNEDKKIQSQFLGQIFISYSQIKKQAREYSINEKEEFIRMLVHGLLHLVGFDHDTKLKEDKMFVLQEKIVTKVAL